MPATWCATPSARCWWCASRPRLPRRQQLVRHRVGTKRSRPVAAEERAGLPQEQARNAAMNAAPPQAASEARARPAPQARATRRRNDQDARPIEEGGRAGLERVCPPAAPDAAAQLRHEGPIARHRAAHARPGSSTRSRRSAASVRRRPDLGEKAMSSASSSAGSRAGCGGCGHRACGRCMPPLRHSSASGASRNSNGAPISDDL